MIRTFETRLDLRAGDGPALSIVLHEYAALMSLAERLLHAKLKAGREWSGDLKVSFYQHLGMSATHLDMTYRQLQGKLKSISELATLQAKDLTDRIKSKKKDIERKQKALAKAFAEHTKLPAELLAIEAKIAKRRAMLVSAKDSTFEKQLFALKVHLGQLHAKKAAKDSIDARIRELEAALCQHQIRLERLNERLAKATDQAKRPSICFGTRKLFKAQFNLQANGFSSKAEWRRHWMAARSAQFTLDGNSSKESGNQFARLRLRDDGLFDMELRLPKALSHLAQRVWQISGADIYAVDLRGIPFNHGDQAVQRAIEGGKPVSVKFLRDDKSWQVLVTVDDVVERQEASYSYGAIGVDLNAGHISVAYIDASGNPVESFDIPCVTYGRSTDQGKDSIRKAAARLTQLAVKLGVPVVSEKLDFSEKKNTLKDSCDPRYARMLSAFAYSAFDAALASACLRGRVTHVRVNPAYTSIIGRVKFARRYGLSVHAAASVTIARRVMGFSERLPRSSDGTITVPTNGSVHVTLALPARNDPGAGNSVGARHVWTEWNVLNKEYHKKALAARRSSGRSRPGWRPKTPTGRSGAPLHGLSAEVGRSYRMPLQSREPGVARVPGRNS